MKRISLIIAFFLIFPVTFCTYISPHKHTFEKFVATQVPILENDRIYNKSGSQCGWASLETLARYHQISSLYNITDEQKDYLNFFNVEKVLEEKNVRFAIQRRGNKNINFIRKYVTYLKYGVAFGINGTHMLVLCHYDEKKGIVRVINNAGDHALEIEEWSIEKFNKNWDGFGIALIPN